MELWPASLAAIAMLSLGLPLPVDAQTLRIAPGPEVLDGEPVQVLVDGLRPGEEVTLRAARWFAGTSARARLFHSEVRLQADAQGRLDLGRVAPISGSYQGVDPRGIFWSMTVDPEAGKADRSVDTARVELELRRDAAPTLAASVRLLRALEDVVSTPVPGFPGARFARLPGTARRPALILLGGSEGGGMIADAAAPLASHGFAVLALPYYSPADETGKRELPELPEAMVEIPVELLDRAYAWLASRDDVDADRVAIHGTSVGATFALLAGVHCDWVDAVVANVPSDVVFDGWGTGIAEGSRSAFSVRGQPLDFVPVLGYEAELARSDRQLDTQVRRAYQRGRAARPDLATAARIPVERIRGEVMVVGSWSDQKWASGAMAQNIAERRLEAGRPVTALVYTDAGHLLYDTGYAPTTHYRRNGNSVGGTAADDARAQAEVWPATIRFLQRTLRLGNDGAVDSVAAPEPRRLP